MHLLDGLLDGPTSAVTAVVAAGGVGYSLRRLSTVLQDRAVPLMGVTAACVFAGQMINFPVVAGASGHLLGGVLTAVLLGPWAAAVTITVVLLVQCFLFGDGGLLSLGANVFNMAVLGTMVGYCIYAAGRRLIRGRVGIAAAAIVAAWFSVLLASAACAIELAASGTYPLKPALTTMLFVHAFIGVGEALITGLAIAFVLRTRPDLIYEPDAPSTTSASVVHVLVGGLALALVVAVFLSPWASSLPDGLEWSAESLGGIPETPAILAGPIPDYEMPGIETLSVATAFAGLLGTLVVFGIAFAIGRSLRAGPAAGETGHAA